MITSYAKVKTLKYPLITCGAIAFVIVTFIGVYKKMGVFRKANNIYFPKIPNGGLDSKINELIQYFNSSAANSALHLDNTRTLFVKKCANTLVLLFYGSLVNRNSFNVLLLGRKGVGKTTLLTTLMQSAINFFGNKCICHMLTYPNDGTPVQEINKKLKLKLKGNASVRDLVAELEARRLVVFIVLDEFQNVFLSDCKDGKEIINQSIDIGQSLSGRIFCVITGSSSDLRGLCFAKRALDQSSWPNYSQRDMNEVKFTPFWIFPFLEPDDFLGVVKRISETNRIQIPEDDNYMAALYETSGGNPSFIQKTLTSSFYPTQNYSNMNHVQINSPEHAVLRYVRNLITVATANALPMTRLKRLELLMQMQHIDMNSAKSQLVLLSPDIIVISTLFNMADKGLIRFAEDSISNGWLVGLGYPSLATSVFEDSTVSLLDVVSMNNTTGYTDNSVNFVLRFLSINSVDWLGERLNPFDGEMDLSNLPIAPEKIVQYLWKEILNNRDTQGSDGFILLSNPDTEQGYPSYHLKRLQINLAQGTRSQLQLDDYNKIWNRWNTNANNVIQYFTDAGYIIVDVEYILVTNCNYIPADMESFLSRSISHNTNPATKITLLDRSDLAEKVWPPEIKDLKGPYV